MQIGGWLGLALSVASLSACGSSSDGGGGGGATGSAGSQGSAAGAGGGSSSAGASPGSSGASSQAGSGSAGSPGSGGGSSSAEWACLNSGGICDCQVPFTPQPAGTPKTCAEAQYDCCYSTFLVTDRCRCMPLQQGSGTCADIAKAVNGKVVDHCPP